MTFCYSNFTLHFSCSLHFDSGHFPNRIAWFCFWDFLLANGCSLTGLLTQGLSQSWSPTQHPPPPLWISHSDFFVRVSLKNVKVKFFSWNPQYFFYYSKPAAGRLAGWRGGLAGLCRGRIEKMVFSSSGYSLASHPHLIPAFPSFQITSPPYTRMCSCSFYRNIEYDCENDLDINKIDCFVARFNLTCFRTCRIELVLRVFSKITSCESDWDNFQAITVSPKFIIWLTCQIIR